MRKKKDFMRLPIKKRFLPSKEIARLGYSSKQRPLSYKDWPKFRSCRSYRGGVWVFRLRGFGHILARFSGFCLKIARFFGFEHCLGERFLALFKSVFRVLP